MTPRFVIHLLSGGLDSVTLLWKLRHENCQVHCLLFDYLQPHSQELEFAKFHCRTLNVNSTIVHLPNFGGLKDGNWIVPNRNATFLSIAVAMAVNAKSECVTIGCNADDAAMFPDCRASFISAMNAAVDASGLTVEISAPFINMRKREIAGLAKYYGLPIYETWSCYIGGDKECGTCPACLQRKEALA